ncbi:hypothetical protein MHBO_002246, partial [Bonamia ostreae]
MTTYWISNPRQYCRDCKTYIDSKPENVRKHEAGAKHQKAMKKRRNMLRDQNYERSATKHGFEKQMELVEKAARDSYKKDSSYFSMFDDQSRFEQQDRFLEMANFSKFPPIPKNEDNFQKFSKGFKPPPGMSSATTPTWLYKDEEGRVQGPWKLSEMILWNASGFFDKEMEVRNISKREMGWLPINCWAEIVGEENVQQIPKQNVGTNSKHKNFPNGDDTKISDKNDSFKNTENVNESTGMGEWTPVPSTLKPENSDNKTKMANSKSEKSKVKKMDILKNDPKSEMSPKILENNEKNKMLNFVRKSRRFEERIEDSDEDLKVLENDSVASKMDRNDVSSEKTQKTQKLKVRRKKR